MDKYRRVPKPREDISQKDIKDNEIRVRSTGRMRNYINFADGLFKENKADSVVLKAMGRTINKTVTIAEILKRHVPELHQITKVDSQTIVDTYEPLEEGLDVVTIERHVSSIEITLSQKPLDSTDIGYQAPKPISEMEPLSEDIIINTWDSRGRGRGRGIGFRGRGAMGGGFPPGRGAFRGRGGFNPAFRGRGRGRGMGRGRGGFRGRGRGRGRGGF